MAFDPESKFLPDALQTTLHVSMGAAVNGINAMLNPMESVPAVLNQVKNLVDVPPEAATTPQDLAQALAGNFMASGAAMFQSCRKTGRRFTGDMK